MVVKCLRGKERGLMVAANSSKRWVSGSLLLWDVET